MTSNSSATDTRLSVGLYRQLICRERLRGPKNEHSVGGTNKDKVLFMLVFNPVCVSSAYHPSS